MWGYRWRLYFDLKSKPEILDGYPMFRTSLVYSNEYDTPSLSESSFNVIVSFCSFTLNVFLLLLNCSFVVAHLTFPGS